MTVHLLRARLALAVLGLAVMLVLATADRGSGAPPRSLPKSFFGIAPQTELTPPDIEHMKAGGITSVRLPVLWSGVQPTARGGYNWEAVDAMVSVVTRGGLEVLPVLVGTPSWIGKETTLPINNARARSAWISFLKAAAARYGPGGVFWREHRKVGPGPTYEPAIPRPIPIRNWQIWNEANFFYFTFPASPRRYAKLVKLSSQAVKSIQPGAKILLAGLFGEPNAGGAKGMDAAPFLSAFYKVPGIKAFFDGVALHPYAITAEDFEEMVEDLHEVTKENRDRPGLYITEIGWGSENNFRQVAFEQGPQGQVRQLRSAYGYLIANQRRLNVKQTFWYSWKDLPDSCSFCDSVGLFREGPKFKPKPAWRAFVKLTGGRLRP